MAVINIDNIYEKLDMGEEAPKISYILPGFVASTIGGINAPGSTGKSFFTQQILYTVATGKELWHPLYHVDADMSKPLNFNNLNNGLLCDEPSTGPVALLNLEDPQQIITDRYYSFLKVIPVTDRTSFCSEFVSVETPEQRIVLLDKDLKVNDENVDFVRRIVEGRRLLIIDTLRRIHDADENCNGAMSKLLSIFEAIARDTGCAIIYLHHTNKSANMNGKGEEAGAARGASALVDNSRWSVNLVGLRENDSDNIKNIHKTPQAALEAGEPWLFRGYFVKAVSSKINYGRPGAGDCWYTRGKGGVLFRIVDPPHFAQLSKSHVNNRRLVL
jgi:hypothetical protein